MPFALAPLGTGRGESVKLTPGLQKWVQQLLTAKRAVAGNFKPVHDNGVVS